MTVALLVMLVAANPSAVAVILGDRADRTVLAAGLAATGGLAVALALSSDPILDLLSVNAATFRVAAGAVLGLTAAVWLVRGPRLLRLEDDLVVSDEDRTGTRWSDLLVPVLIPALVTPQWVAVSIAIGADEGVLVAAVAAAVALAVAGVATTLFRGRLGLWSAGTRLVAVVGAVVALGLVVDGIKTV